MTMVRVMGHPRSDKAMVVVRVMGHPRGNKTMAALPNMAGKDREVQYPGVMNLSVNRPSDVIRGGLIQMDHDIAMVKHLFSNEYTCILVAYILLPPLLEMEHYSV